jgi:hypothetical protein
MQPHVEDSSNSMPMIELDDRLTFGMFVDGLEEEGTNNGCSNTASCAGTNPSCTNASQCGGSNDSCTNTSCLD